MAEDSIPRRNFLKGVGAAGAGAVTLTTGLQTVPAEAAATAQAGSTPAEQQAWLVLTAEEVAFFSASADTMIPADELSPSGTDCGVPVFIDRQLASAWGAGAKMYRAGPFHQGLPEQGYQLAADAARFFCGRRSGGQCLVAQDLWQDIRSADTRPARRSADSDAERQGRIRRL